MGNLNSDVIKFLAENKEKIDKAYRTQIYFCFKSKEKGAKAFDMLREAYSENCNYYAYGIDYRDFYLGFTSKDTRNDVYDDIIAAITEYHTQYGYGTSNGYSGVFGSSSSSGSSGNSGSGNEDYKKEIKKTSSYTYIIIGALVILAILLLWPGKRK